MDCWMSFDYSGKKKHQTLFGASFPLYCREIRKSILDVQKVVRKGQTL